MNAFTIKSLVRVNDFQIKTKKHLKWRNGLKMMKVLDKSFNNGLKKSMFSATIEYKSLDN